MSKSRLKNESGMAFIGAVFMISGLIMTYLFISTRYYTSLSEEADRSRRLIAASEIASSLAVEIRRGFDRSASCPGGAYQNRLINGVNYCLPAQVCVPNPYSRIGAGVAADQVCWNWNTAEADIGFVDPWDQWKHKMYVHWNRGLYKTGKTLVQLGSHFLNVSFAQATPDIHLPTLVGAGPAVNLNPINCAAGPNQPHCQRCDNNSWGTAAACVRLGICLFNNNCPDDNFRIYQWIGFER